MRRILVMLCFFSMAQAEIYFSQIHWGGRLGDQLLMYVKAKWLCKKFNGRMKVHHFEYADQLKGKGS